MFSHPGGEMIMIIYLSMCARLLVRQTDRIAVVYRPYNRACVQ